MSNNEYLFPDENLTVLHEAFLFNKIVLYTTPFHEMDEERFIGKECWTGDPQNSGKKLSALKNNMKAQARQGVPYQYTGKQAAQWKREALICEVCDKEFELDRDKKGDHDHITGEWRGVLCAACNIAVGWFEKLEREAELKVRIKRYLKL